MMAGVFNDAVSFYQGIGQARAARGLFSAAQGLSVNANVQTAWTFGGKIVGVIGTERVIGQLVKFGVKLALKSRGVDQRAGTEMVDLMRSRVPQDTGRLLNGITSEDDGEMITVSATAARDGDADYAPFVEFGTKDNGVANDDFFASGADAGIPLRRSGGHHGETPAEPFFWDSARETLANYRKNLDDVIDESASEEGLT